MPPIFTVLSFASYILRRDSIVGDLSPFFNRIIIFCYNLHTFCFDIAHSGMNNRCTQIFHSHCFVCTVVSISLLISIT